MTLDRYEARTTRLMSALSLIFLVVYSVPVIWPDLSPAALDALRSARIVIWLAFVVDLGTRVTLADQPVRYLAHNPVDVLAIFVPMLRPLRVLRVFAGGQRVLTRSGGLVRTGRAVMVSTLLLIVIGAVAVLDAERGRPGAVITSFADALWWAVVTVTTVGYGDFYPVTGTGRVVASTLMLVGVSVVGVLTAVATTWFVVPAPAKVRSRPASTGTAGAAEADGAVAGDDAADASDHRLRALADLHRAGVLTDAELGAATARLLDRT
ncbi:MAG TPA: potassium channel family protein [Actinotalea sp.]|nr:potassium channel family protein [Actinotalea sp.]